MRLLLISLMLLITTPALAIIAIDSNFDAGNGLADATFESPTDTLHIYTERDHVSHNNWTDWFYFKLTDVTGKNLTINVDFAYYTTSSYWGANNSNIRPVWSYDNINWTRLTTVNSFSNSVLNFSLPTMTQDTVYVSMDYPRRYSDVVTDYATWSSSGYATTAETLSYSGITTSQGGRNLYHLTIEEPGYYTNRLHLVITGSAHPGEVNGSHMMKGMVDWLTSEDAAAVEVRRKSIIDFYPAVNPDGMYNGRLRAFDDGTDGNRGWDITGPNLGTEPNETFLVHSSIHALSGVDFSVDLHGNYEYDVRVVDDNTNDNWSAGDESSIMTLLVSYDTQNYFRDTFIDMPTLTYTSGYRIGQILQYSRHSLGVEGGVYYAASGNYPTSTDREEGGANLLRALVIGMEVATQIVGSVTPISAGTIIINAGVTPITVN